MISRFCEIITENFHDIANGVFSKNSSSSDEQLNIKMMSIATNWMCNLRCEICDIWKKKDKTILSPSLLRASLQSPFFDNVECVGFFGGETTLHPALPELMQVIKDRFGINAAIVTNGYGKHIPDIFNNLKDFNPLICVSIDGQKNVHDIRRGKKGSYEDALRTLARANDLFSQKPRISFTVLPDTVNELSHILELAKKFNTDISMRAGVSGSYFGGKSNEKWSEHDIKQLEDQLSNIPDSFLTNPFFVRDIPEFLRSGKVKIQCKAAYNILVVDPDMNTRICHSLEPICKLADVPKNWGKHPEWKAAKNGRCFKRECFIDGPYSTSWF
ncbi:Radical SAM superfamily protein [uncultured archaeon]|nr:Radical SAM superfamily protein [uncultured archaeon]